MSNRLGLKYFFYLIAFLLLSCFGISNTIAQGNKPPAKKNSENLDSLKNLYLPPDTGKYVPTTRPKIRPKDRQGDPFSNPNDGSPLILDNPNNITTKVELDSSTNTYTIFEKVGNLDFRPVSTMTFEEYSAWKMRQSMRDYMKAKADANSGGGALGNNRLIPIIYVNPALERIFGGNDVDIRPNGSVVLDFGGQSQRSFNPALPIRQQRNSQFLFDQQISLNVQGKIGQKLRMNINFDTKASFEFENQVKLDYTGLDHEILQKVEAGNVSLPISSSLITGAQNLFGVKTTMQFGKLKVVSVISNQRGRAEKITVKGNGAQAKQVNIRADEYEANRHFFISQFHRNNFERALANPTIPGTTSGVIVRRVEVYITNRTTATQNLRNIAAFIDLGEGTPIRNAYQIAGQDSTRPAANAANRLFGELSADNAIRSAEGVRDRLLGAPYNFTQSTDFEVVRSARRLDPTRDYTFHEQLGYISLNSPLNFDEVLAVAYQYTFNGQTFQVGELQNDISNRGVDDVIFLKLLRPAVLNTRLPTWNLQMKNIYSLGSSQVSREGFQIRVIYRDDSSGVDNPVLRQGERIRDRQLVEVFRADQINMAGERGPDGIFDFVEGITIDSRNGRIIFPVLEPFGSHLERQFNPNTEIGLISKYVFFEMYRSTQQDALQAANKAKFFISGRIQSAGGSEIMLPGVNIAPGSVQVFAGGEVLQENTHFTVDYTLGRVRITDPGILNSGKDIDIRYEKADLFSFQRRTFMGTRLDYAYSKDINLGGTLLYMNETPLVRRVAMGEEPTRNVLWGLDANYRKDSRFITKLIDKLPLYSTKEVSTVTASAEYARMVPGSSRFVDRNGGGISYIDDFESVRTPTDLGRSIMMWKLASPPLRFKTNTANPLTYNFNRGHLAWFSIDNIFYRNSGQARPRNIEREDLANNYQRLVEFNEVFPNRDRAAINLPEQTFDLNFYPEERGMYNFNPDLNSDGTLRRPQDSWAGIMRPITTNTDFDAANVEYIEFWMMDPFISGESGQIGGNLDGSLRRGQLFFDLGTFSEDVLEDNLQAFENGLPTPGQALVRTDTTRYGRVTRQQHITNAFAITPGARAAQDIGLDGLDDVSERQFHTSGTESNQFLRQIQGVVNPEAFQRISNDPAADNFRYYLGDEQDANTPFPRILNRYKFFNGVQGNSPEAQGNALFTASATQMPDNEDLNGDNTVSNTDQYFSYKVNITPEDFQPGRNYCVDRIVPPGRNSPWYLFRIPIRDVNHPNFAGRFGNINDFKSIRFVRAYVTGFQVPVALRFVQFQMVASTWRPYPSPLTPPRADLLDQEDASMVVATANIEENGAVAPNKVPYSIPNGIQRDRDVTSGVNRRLNEQSLSVCVDRLRDSESRAVFRNVRLDFLNYRRIRMFIGAYATEPRTRDNEVAAFIRIGTDFTENFYEIEIPLKLTPTGTAGVNPWPNENELNILLDELYAAKLRRNADSIPLIMSSPFYPVEGTNQRVSITGNPDLNNANVVMLGIRNTESSDRRAKSVCVWFNEMRVTDFIKNQGWAATGRVALKLADLGTVTASTRYVGVGFGGIEQRISERSRAETWAYQFSAQLALDKFTPKKWGLRLPMYVSYEQNRMTPQFDQLNPDIPLSATVNAFEEGDFRASVYRRIQQDITTRRSINFTNVGKSKTRQDKIPQLWDIENLNFTYAYNETKRTSINLEDFFQIMYNYGLGYNYSINAKPIEPFKNTKGFMESPWLKLIKEVNFSYLPAQISARADLRRFWTKTQLRSANVFLTGENNPIVPTFEKNFFLDRQYGLRYLPFKSLTIDYASTANALIDELSDTVRNVEARRNFERNSLRNGGRVKNFNQSIRANYRLPFKSFPLTDWIDADVTYNATFNWQANQLAIADTLGNIVQNSRDQQANVKLDLLKLYNKVKFLSKINNPTPPPPPKVILDPATGKELPDTTKRPPELKLLKALLRTMMSLRSINLSYQVTENMMLPGYLPTLDLFGYNFGRNQSDWWRFILGDQDPNVRLRLRDQNLMARSPFLTQPFTQMKTENIQGRTQLEPIRDFRLQIDARLQTQGNYSEVFRSVNSLNDVPNFQSQSGARTGSYSVSFIAIRTAFDRDDSEFRTPAFRTFENFRSIMRGRLEADGGRNTARFDTNSQDVLIPAFIAAYTGANPRTSNLSPFPLIPLPNWRVDYAGLTRLPFLAKKFSSITLTHSYTSNYTIGNYAANTEYDLSFFQLNRNLSDYRNLRPTLARGSGGQDSIFQPVLIVNQVVISERFSPLVGINIRTKSKITIRCDYNRERNIALSVNNAQITELNSQDLTIGLGWAKSGLKLPFKNKGRIIVLENELRIQFDVTFRDTRTIQRALEQVGQITAGMQDIQIKPTLNYMLSQRLSIQAYIEHTRNLPRISNSFERRLTRFGVQLRFSLM